MPPATLVSGTIGFDPDQPDLSGARVRVRLEDVSRADASADVVATQVIDDPAERLTEGRLPFRLSGDRDDIDPSGRYSVAVHVDMDNSGSVSSGDYINTASTPVLTGGHPDQVSVSVEQI